MPARTTRMRKKRRRRGGGCVLGQSMNSCIAGLHSRQLHHYPHNTPSASASCLTTQALPAPLQTGACWVPQVFTRKGEFPLGRLLAPGGVRPVYKGSEVIRSELNSPRLFP